MELRERVLTVLKKSSVADHDGFATRRLAAKMGKNVDPRVLNGVLRRMDHAGLIVRTVDGKRTYEIALGPNGAEPAPQESPTPWQEMSGEPDYDKLAQALLFKALDALQLGTKAVELQVQAQNESAAWQVRLGKAEKQIAALNKENTRLQQEIDALKVPARQAPKLTAAQRKSLQELQG